jgi:chorismate mutase
MTSALMGRALRCNKAECKRQSGDWRERARMLAEPAMSQTPPSPDPVLAGYRASIDNIDAALIHMLAERFRITKAVGAYKAQQQLPPSDPGREERQIARLRKLAEDAQLDPEFSEKFLRFIIQEVIRHHEQAQGAK